MELYESCMRFTFGSTVLLDYGDLMLGGPSLPQQHSIQTQAYLRSDWVDVWDRGGVRFSSEISVVREYAIAAAALEARLAHALEVAELRHSLLKIEVQNGTQSFEFAAASITAADPLVMPELGDRRVVWAYSITASRLSETI